MTTTRDEAALALVATSAFNNAETAITSKRVAWTISDSCVQPDAGFVQV
jgi:hypothetical protein